MRPFADRRPALPGRQGAPGVPKSRQSRSAGAPLVIAIVSDAIYPYHMGGKEMRYHHVINGLVERNIEVHVFTMRWWNGPRSKREGGAQLHALCRRFPLYRGGRRSVLQAAMFAVACLRLVVYRYDLIEADHMPHLQLFTIRAVAWARRVPLVVTWHEFWGPEYWREYVGWPAPLAAAIERLSLRQGDAIVTPSSETMARLVEQGVPQERVSVVPNGVDLDLIDNVEPSTERFDVLYVGRLIAHKHVDLLIEAMVELRVDDRPVTCAIVGDGPEFSTLENLVNRFGLDKRVQFFGNLQSHSEIFGLMKSARVFVLPSTREGFGMVVAEAIACGLSVITTNHEDNQARVLVEHGVTGWLCEPTAESLASYLSLVLSGSAPTQSDEAVQASRTALLERLSWRASVEALVQVFSDTRSAGAP
jgi:glycosyltransferase involved in cell wall biosynthesis